MRCALIGLGMVAETHLAALAASNSVDLVGVLGHSPERIASFRKKHPFIPVYDDLEAVSTDPDVEFVILATPPDARQEITKRLIAGGKPILMEKPIERDLERATRLVEICERADIPLGIVLQHRTRAASRALKIRLDRGELGDLVSVDIRVPWWRPQSYYNTQGRGTYARDGGGVMITQAIHTLDLALWFAGPVRACQAMTATTALHSLEAEDWAAALLHFESGAVGVMSATTAAYPGRSESLFLQGTKASAHLANGVLRVAYLDGSEALTGTPTNTGAGADPMDFTHAWHQAVIEDFAGRLRHTRPPVASGRDALAAHRLIDAIERAARAGTEVAL